MLADSGEYIDLHRIYNSYNDSLLCLLTISFLYKDSETRSRPTFLIDVLVGNSPFFGTSETHQWPPGRVEVTKVDVTSGQGQVAPMFTNTFPISIKIYEDAEVLKHEYA